MDVVRLAYYPFLPQVRDVVRELGPDVPTLLSSSLYAGARKRGVQRLEGALDQGIPQVVVTNERGALHELLSVPIARMLAVMTRERFVIERYARGEAARLAATLDQDPEVVPVVAEALALPLQSDGDAWRLHVTDYLRAVPPRQDAWKLVLQPVRGGWVPLDRRQAIGLCEEALFRRIKNELEAERERPLPADLRQALTPLMDRLQPRLEALRERLDEGDFGPVRRDLFPPCMKELLDMMGRGEMLPHHGRFSMAAFMHTIGLGAEQIIDFFRGIPNFDPDKSRYQIEHIAGERSVEGYTPPGCDWMQTNGVCPLAKRDGLCMKIKHPLSYYRAKIRFDKQAQEEGARVLAEAKAKKEAAA